MIYLQEKQSFFRSSSLKNKHVSITGRMSLTPPQTLADNTEFDVLVDKLRIQVDHFENSVKEIRDTDCHGDAKNLEYKLRVNNLDLSRDSFHLSSDTSISSWNNFGWSFACCWMMSDDIVKF